MGEGVFKMKLDDLKILICDDSILARKQMKDIINSIGSPTIIEAANWTNFSFIR